MSLSQQADHKKSNLLILIINENNKRYGAFTPCEYDK